MLIAALGVLAEGVQIAPLYATVGEALEDDSEGRVVSGGVQGEYYAVVTKKNGQYYRSVAYYDEKLNEMNAALESLDYEAEDFFERHEAAMQEIDDYIKTLPVAYSEVFTAPSLTDEEIAAMRGKTLSQLTGEGFEIGEYGTEFDEDDEMIVVYTLRYGVYDYSCVIDADYDQYCEVIDNDAEGDLVVTDVELAGITAWGFEKRFHTDGTVDEPEDPFAEVSSILSEIMAFIEKAAADEEADFEAFADELKARYPDYADMIDMYLTLYEAYGAEGFASMMTPAE